MWPLSGEANRWNSSRIDSLVLFALLVASLMETAFDSIQTFKHFGELAVASVLFVAFGSVGSDCASEDGDEPDAGEHEDDGCTAAGGCLGIEVAIPDGVRWPTSRRYADYRC